MSASSEGEIIDATDGLLQIRLDRPERKNALAVGAIERVIDALELTSRTMDVKEGLAAFREGRPPHFTGA